VDHALIEAERSPWELVDLVPAKASHRAQQKDLNCSGFKLASSALAHSRRISTLKPER
jgi:hypothetical protein